MLPINNKVLELAIVIPEPKYIRYLIFIAIPIGVILCIFLINLFGVELGIFRMLIPMVTFGLIITYNRWRNKYNIIGKIIFKNHAIIFQREFEEFAIEIKDIKIIVFDYSGFQSEIISSKSTGKDFFEEGYQNTFYFEFLNQFRTSEKLQVFIENKIQKENLMAYLDFYGKEVKVKINLKHKV